jgi:hypothetical protein
MEATLDWRKDSLCVRVTSEILDGLKNRSAVTQWFPLYSAAEEEVRALVGRPLAATSLAEGLYADEDGNVYQLPNKAATRAIDVEWRSLRPERSADQRGARMRRKNNRSGGELKAGKDETGAPSELNGSSPAAIDEIDGGELQDRLPTENGGFPPPSLLVRPLNLRQKLALVRRRLSYVQKRGYNEAQQYRYVTAADIAGAVGDILAEIGVIVIPRLDAIEHESAAGAGQLTRVIMSYGFMDADSAEEITVKIAGEGLDHGDKGPYKAMTGALKYALMQSLLLATGDDPEDERLDAHAPAAVAAVTISAREARHLRRLLAETDTALERVLAYYKIDALEEMTPAIYRRAVDALMRKRALRQDKGGATNAQN